MSIFDRKTGNYVGSDPIGRTDDTLMHLISRPRTGQVLTAEESAKIAVDLRNLLEGTDIRMSSDMVRSAVREIGFDPDGIVLTPEMRMQFREQLLDGLRKRTADKFNHGTLETALLLGQENDMITLPCGGLHGSLGLIRTRLRELGHTPESFSLMSDTKKDKITIQLEKKMRREAAQMRGGGVIKRSAVHGDPYSEGQRDRQRLHLSLHPWAGGPLVVERPQASSLHHLIEYDKRETPGDAERGILSRSDLQSLVVENDWARAGVPPAERGDRWITPFRRCCWEMRISGVRVLAFTEVDKDEESMVMFCVYGRDKIWVSDDYIYDIGSGVMRGRPHEKRQDVAEFRRVATLVHDTIRACCIMMDAKVAAHEAAPVSRELVRSAQRKGYAPPRDHLVVRLLKAQHRRAVHVARGHVSGLPRTPQRGHWRRGTWVHYDDQDSGRVQYVNDGGFMVSKTWRSWHFAGDPNNIIQREYRL